MQLDQLVVGQRKMSNLEPLTAKQLRDAARDRVYIYNVGPREHRVAVGRIWTIPACPKDARVSAALVIDGTIFTSRVRSVHGMSATFEWMPEDGIDVARDIVGTAPFKHESENLTKLGVFIAAGVEATDEEIEKAHKQWIARCNEKLFAADQRATVNNGMVNVNGRAISDIGPDDIEAARTLGVDRSWAQKNQQLVLCDECGIGNLTTAAFCKQCDNLLNAEAAQRKFPAKYAALQGDVEVEKRGPGRPKKELVTQ